MFRERGLPAILGIFGNLFFRQVWLIPELEQVTQISFGGRNVYKESWQTCVSVLVHAVLMIIVSGYIASVQGLEENTSLKGMKQRA
jgi:hypothetical protein